jgi:hypothetical protein
MQIYDDIGESCRGHYTVCISLLALVWAVGAVPWAHAETLRTDLIDGPGFEDDMPTMPTLLERRSNRRCIVLCFVAMRLDRAGCPRIHKVE